MSLERRLVNDITQALWHKRREHAANLGLDLPVWENTAESLQKEIIDEAEFVAEIILEGQ